MLLDLLKKIKTKREQALRRELQHRAEELIRLEDKAGKIYVTYRGLSIYRVIEEANVAGSVGEIYLSEAIVQMGRLRQDYVENHISQHYGH